MLAAAAEPLENRLLFASIAWISGHVGDFSNAANWVGGVVPNGNDDAIINGSGSSVTISVGQQLNTITAAAGTTLTVAAGGTLQDLAGGSIAGAFTINGDVDAADNSGSLTASGTTTLNSPSGLIQATGFVNTGGMTIVGGSLNGRLSNSGTLNISAIAVSGGANLINLAGGTLNITGATGITSTTVVNSGTMNVAAGPGGTETLAAGGTFKNTGGTIHVTSGELLIDASISLVDTNFIVASGSSVVLDNVGNNNLSGTITGSGAGTVVFNSGSFVGALPDNNSSTATLSFPNGMAQVAGAALTNSGTIVNTGFLDYVGSAAHGRMDFTNQGTIRDKSTTDLMFGVFTNDSAGVIDLQGDVSISGIFANDSFINKGTIRKSAGAGTSIVGTVGGGGPGGPLFINDGGTIAVETGKLSFQAVSIIYKGGPLTVATVRDVGFRHGFGGCGRRDDVGQRGRHCYAHRRLFSRTKCHRWYRRQFSGRAQLRAQHVDDHHGVHRKQQRRDHQRRLNLLCGRRSGENVYELRQCVFCRRQL